VAEGVAGPGLLDDLVVFQEQAAVLLVHLGLVGHGAADAVGLAEHVRPALLVAARDAEERAPLQHLVQHGHVLGQAQRVVERNHVRHLAEANARRLHAEVQAEQDRVVRLLDALDVEMVLREGGAPEPGLVGEFDLLGQLPEHVLVVLRVLPGHALVGLGHGADRRQVKQDELHDSVL
jgi:hypothetical protein